MIIVLLVCLLCLCVTGWLQLTLMFFGSDRLEALHEWASHDLLVLIGLHVTGVIVSSRLPKSHGGPDGAGEAIRSACLNRLNHAHTARPERPEVMDSRARFGAD